MRRVIKEKIALRWFGAKRGWLRPLIISLLQQSPKNGIEIMDAIQERSMGWWRPSPGSVYPLLDDLTVEGVIKKMKDGKYEITKEAEEEIKDVYWWHDWHSRSSISLEDMIKEIKGYFSYMEDMTDRDKPSVHKYRVELEKIRKELDELIEKT